MGFSNLGLLVWRKRAERGRGTTHPSRFACHLPAACGITWEGFRGMFFVPPVPKTYWYLKVFRLTRNTPREPSHVMPQAAGRWHAQRAWRMSSHRKTYRSVLSNSSINPNLKHWLNSYILIYRSVLSQVSHLYHKRVGQSPYPYSSVYKSS